MDFDMFNKMKAEKLKNFFCSRGLKVTGKKAVLVTRAFFAFKNNVALIKTAAEVEADLKQEYDEKLKLNVMNIPDPSKLNNRWLGVKVVVVVVVE